MSVEQALERIGTPSDVLARHQIIVRRRMALCPLHENTRTPALSVYKGKDGKERWKCHAGCGSGDALDLEARIRGISVAELLREYA